MKSVYLRPTVDTVEEVVGGEKVIRQIPRRVRKESDAEPLEAAGEKVSLTPFWRRRLSDGDVELCDPPPIEATPAANEPDAKPEAEAEAPRKSARAAKEAN